VYALQYRAEQTPGVTQTIIAWLTPEGDDANGNSHAEDPGKRLVNVQPGEWIVNGGDRWQVLSVQVYR
jgi:hypothetical protein